MKRERDRKRERERQREREPGCLAKCLLRHCRDAKRLSMQITTAALADLLLLLSLSDTGESEREI